MFTMYDTLAYQMLKDPQKTAEYLYHAQRRFRSIQKSWEVSEMVSGVLYPNKRTRLPMAWKASYLSDTEKNYIDFLIYDGATEFELRQIESEIQLWLHWRAPETFPYIIQKKNGEKVETIVEMTTNPDTCEMKISQFSFQDFTGKNTIYIALNGYIRFRMKQQWYKYVLETSSFPKTLRFGKEPFEYKVPTKIELVSTVESDALLWIVR